MLVRAPKLHADGWINGGPLTLESLRGKAVLLDFFTYGCINCMANMPVLDRLQSMFEGTLQVIGIHSGKFSREKEHNAVEAAVRRLKIHYPVLNDASGRLLDQYAVRAWPTLVLIDAGGYIAAVFRGEGQEDALMQALAGIGIFPGSKPEAGKPDAGQLLFPENVLCGASELFVANTGNGAVWCSDPTGRVSRVYDGFEAPAGLWTAENRLFVADRGSGEVIAVNLHDGRRTMLLGGLRSPSAVAVRHHELIVAEAGTHRIRAFDIDTLEPRWQVGNRFEALRDGKGSEAQLAQPSGLALCDEGLWFVDAESSALRRVLDGKVETFIGEGLFTFGDSDAGELLLQHPQGVACGIVGDGCGGGRLFIADTYNGKIKAYDPQSETMLTLVEGLKEPGGISKCGCKLYIAETNAHAVAVFDLSAMQASRLHFAL